MNTVFLAVQPDGKILAGGFFSSVGGQTRYNIARLDPVTGAADLFDPNVVGFSVYTLALQPDGKILLGGNFHTVGGETRQKIARLDGAMSLELLIRLTRTRAGGMWKLSAFSPMAKFWSAVDSTPSGAAASWDGSSRRNDRSS